MAQSRDLPEGPGKSLVEKVCGDCHGTEVYTGKHRDAQQWNATIDRMIRHGATATDAQFDEIVNYLVKHFGPGEQIGSAAAKGAMEVRDSCPPGGVCGRAEDTPREFTFKLLNKPRP
jgi:hypothetical protein